LGVVCVILTGSTTLKGVFEIDKTKTFYKGFLGIIFGKYFIFISIILSILFSLVLNLSISLQIIVFAIVVHR
jgi:hypothetical protein